MDIGPLAIFSALNIFAVKKLTDFAKEVLPNNISNKAVQGISVVVGVLLAWLFSVSDFGNFEVVNGKTLDQLNVAGIVIFGLAWAAGAGVLNDGIERRNPDAYPDGT